MTIRIDGGTVVGWSGAHHELIPEGSVLIDGETIRYVGTDRTRAADKTIDASGKLVCPGIHIHAAGNLRELVEILYRHRKSAIEYLADTGVLRPGTVLGHTVFIAGHSRMDFPFGDELKLLAVSGASVGHCPHKYAKMAIAAESFDRYVEAGVNVGLGWQDGRGYLTAGLSHSARLRWKNQREEP